MKFQHSHPGSFTCPEYSSYTRGSPFYVPIRRTMMNTMDIYYEKMNDMGASSGHRTRVFRLNKWRKQNYTEKWKYFKSILYLYHFEWTYVFLIPRTMSTLSDNVHVYILGMTTNILVYWYGGWRWAHWRLFYIHSIHMFYIHNNILSTDPHATYL